LTVFYGRRQGAVARGSIGKVGLQLRVEQLQGYTAREAKYDGYNATFDGRNSFSKTGKDDAGFSETSGFLLHEKANCR